MKKKFVLSFILGELTGILTMYCLWNKTYKKIITDNNAKIKRLESYYQILNLWIKINHSGQSLTNYLEKNNFNKVAIYGMGELGDRLVEEIKKQSKISICYTIDNSASSSQRDLRIYRANDNWSEEENVDLIIVTPVFAYEEIKKTLEQRTDIPIISLGQLLEECYMKK